MKKINKLILTSLGMAATIAPVATIVSCGSASKPHYVAQDAEELTKNLFTPTELHARAVAEGDKSYWTGGLKYHAVSQSVSILRELAREYGYDTAARVKALGANLITDADATKIETSDSVDVKVLKGIKPQSTPVGIKGNGNQQLSAYAIFGDNEAFSARSFGELNDYNLELNSSQYETYHYRSEDSTGLNVSSKNIGDKNDAGTTTLNLSNTTSLTLIRDKTTKEVVYGANMDKNTGAPIRWGGDNDSVAKGPNLHFDSYSIFNDYNHPGEAVMQIDDFDQDNKVIKDVDGNIVTQAEYDAPPSSAQSAYSVEMPFKNLREIHIPGLMQKYATVPPKLFNEEIVPIARKAVKKVTDTLATSADMIKALTKSEEVMLFDEINFLNDKLNETNTQEGVLEIDSQNFTDKLADLNNNGTAHWLALETLYRGLNYEFSSDTDASKVNSAVQPNDINQFVNGDASNAGNDLIGLKNAGLISLVSWAHYSASTPAADSNATSRTEGQWGGYGGSLNNRLAANPYNGFDAQGLKTTLEFNQKTDGSTMPIDFYREQW